MHQGYKPSIGTTCNKFQPKSFEDKVIVVSEIFLLINLGCIVLLCHWFLQLSKQKYPIVVSCIQNIYCLHLYIHLPVTLHLLGDGGADEHASRR